MDKLLPKKFFQRDTIKVAQELLGKILVRNIAGKSLSGRIVETEAYVGFDDQACHASKGKTLRNEVMFKTGGYAYIYMIYGMYYCLNVVTEKKDYPAAVLIRALEPLEGIDKMSVYRNTQDITNLCSGPGKLCQAMGINTKLNGLKLDKTKLQIKNDGSKIGHT